METHALSNDSVTRFEAAIRGRVNRPEDGDYDDANVAWARDCLDDMRRFSDGSTYRNFPWFFEDADDLLRTTFGSTYERLVALKDEYDPTNLFSNNRSVPPSGPDRGRAER